MTNDDVLVALLPCVKAGRCLAIRKLLVGPPGLALNTDRTVNRAGPTYKEDILKLAKVTETGGHRVGKGAVIVVADEETEVLRSVSKDKLGAEETDAEVAKLDNRLVRIESADLLDPIPIGMDITQNNHCETSMKDYSPKSTS